RDTVGQEWSPPYMGPLPIPISGDTRKRHYHHSIVNRAVQRRMNFTAHTVRPTVSAVSDPATQATPENRPFYGISRNLTSRSFQFGKCCLDTKPLMILSQVHLRKDH